MLDLEDQLRRYGEALEHDLLEDSDSKLRSTAATRRPWRRILAVAAAIAVLAGGAVAILVDTTEDQDSVVTADTAKPTDVRRAGVFTTPTDTVLLFSDGIDGATAVDLDRRLAGRRVIDGERAGDQQFRLTLTGDHLVVGWGEIYASPLDGGRSKKIGDATIYLPASEDGEVWTLAWEGGRIGAGSATLRRVEIDGTTVFESTSFDPAILEPVQGVPGGLLVNSPEGVAVWDANTETTGPVLGPGRAVAATTDGQIVAWCADSCGEIHTASLERKGAPTAANASGAQQIALSPDGSLAVLRPDGELTLTSSSASTVGDVVARGLDAFGALMWSQDGEQLFYTENSYGDSSMRVGRYDLETRQWEIETLPIGDGVAAIAVTRDEARSFYAENRVSERVSAPGRAARTRAVATVSARSPSSLPTRLPSALRTVHPRSKFPMPLVFSWRRLRFGCSSQGSPLSALERPELTILQTLTQSCKHKSHLRASACRPARVWASGQSRGSTSAGEAHSANRRATVSPRCRSATCGRGCPETTSETGSTSRSPAIPGVRYAARSGFGTG